MIILSANSILMLYLNSPQYAFSAFFMNEIIYFHGLVMKIINCDEVISVEMQ